MSDRLAEALQDDEAAGECPAVTGRQGQRRHGEKIDRIARDGHEPIAMRPVADNASREAERVADQLPKAGDEADGGGRGPQQQQIRPENASGPFVGEIGEKTDHAEQNEKGVGGFSLIGHRASLNPDAMSIILSILPRMDNVRRYP